MKALLTIAAAIGAPLLAICLRVGQQVVNDGVRVVMYSIAFFIAAMGVAVVLHAVATYRQAQFAKPSHQIDQRTQSFDVRRQTVSLPASEGRSIDTL